MKRQSVRRSTVGIINPVFQNKKGNSFFRANAERTMPATDKEGMFIQKQSADNEMEDSMQMAPEDENEVQLMSESGEEEQVQTKGEEEEVQAKEQKEQAMAKGEEDEVQTKGEEVLAKEEEEQIQMKEEEEQIQAKTAGAGARQEQAELMEPLLHRRKGAGNPLEGKSRKLMEQGFGADFSQIRIHTDAESHRMNQSIHAQAFTYGNDIFFKKDKYRPESREGRHLLAHELTHTIQQKGKKPKTIQGHWSKNETYHPLDKKGIRVAVKLEFAGAVWNKSSNTALDTTGLAAAAEKQVSNSFRGKIKKRVLGIDILYDVTTTASIRVISKLTDLNFGSEHLLVVLDDSHPKVKGTYGRGPFYGTIVYLNEKHIGPMISGADENTIPHEVGHTAGLKHLMEKGEESGVLGKMIKDLHHQANKDNIMWRGGGHPSYSGADADANLTQTNTQQLEEVHQNIQNKKINQLDLFSLVDLYALEK
ncbi:eCIS core domain-containing protein [Cyclobacterium plantarum]|uniref:eCIS core domain-containing protein n=1 Tax=Cyclobacterium plantarum TaxID=2716263 RepID=UPI003F6F497F